jgi:hypothetical protein
MVITTGRGAARGAAFLALALTAFGAQAQVLSPNLLFTSVQPCRIFDTRVGSGGTGPIAANSERTFNVVGNTSSDFTSQGGHAGGCGIPGFFVQQAGPSIPQAQAVVVNLVAVNPQGAGDLRAWATDQPRPLASVLNYAAVAGLNLANAIIVPVRQDQQGADVTLRADVAGTEVVADVVGYLSNNVKTSVALGLGSLAADTTGTYNTALGPSALNKNTAGSFNTAAGSTALQNNTSGTFDTGIGTGAFFDLDGAGDNLAVGHDAMHNHFNGGNGNVAVGAEALKADQTGAGNVAIGFQAGSTQNDSNKLYIGGASASPPLIYGDFSAATVSIVTGNGAPTAPAASLEVHGGMIVDSLGSGQVCSSASGVLSNCSPSDARLKRQVVDLGREVDIYRTLAGLRGVAFSWDTAQPRARQLGPQREIGLVAQEVERVLPQIVSTHPDGYKSVDYAKLSAFLVEVVKSEQSDIDCHQGALDRQQQGIEAVRQRLQQVRQATAGRPPAGE